MVLFNLYKNSNQLNSFKAIISNQEFIFIYNFFKTLSFIQIYNFFKIMEIKLQLSDLCLNSLNIIFSLNISKKNLKKFFLLNCIFFLNKSLLKKNYLNLLQIFFSSSYKDAKKKIIKFYSKNFYIALLLFLYYFIRQFRHSKS